MGTQQSYGLSVNLATRYASDTLHKTYTTTAHLSRKFTLWSQCWHGARPMTTSNTYVPTCHQFHEQWSLPWSNANLDWLTLIDVLIPWFPRNDDARVQRCYSKLPPALNFSAGIFPSIFRHLLRNFVAVPSPEFRRAKHTMPQYGWPKIGGTVIWWLGFDLLSKLEWFESHATNSMEGFDLENAK